ncbi:hypothetical protein ACLKA6_013148 [Drosophila palustris]
MIVHHGGPSKYVYCNTLSHNLDRLSKLLIGCLAKAKEYLIYGTARNSSNSLVPEPVKKLLQHLPSNLPLALNCEHWKSKMLNCHNISIGACDADGKLIAWCLRLPLGSLGLLQVLESHKRLGLGSFDGALHVQENL